MSRVSARATRGLLLLILLGAAWVLWSGLFTPLLLGLGTLSCILTCYLAQRMGYLNDETDTLHVSPRLFGYAVWLAKEVIRSSLEVSRAVLDPRLRISPRTIEITATARHPVDQAILGNSITLTPGTLALDLHRGVIKVHCLTEAGADALMTGEMDRRVAALRAD